MDIRSLFVALTFAGAPALADCPPGQNHTAALDALFDAARSAESEAEAQPLSVAMWDLWTDAPDARAQALLDRGMIAIRLGDGAGALKALDDLVAYCPDYAEGWNQRAFAHYLSGRLDAALSDLTQAYTLQPAHVGILAGTALTLVAMGREEEAPPYLRAAMELNPWIAERHLLTLIEGREL